MTRAEGLTIPQARARGCTDGAKILAERWAAAPAIDRREGATAAKPLGCRLTVTALGTVEALP
jgi:hypothetical protein